jgi:hypothetical protein
VEKAGAKRKSDARGTARQALAARHREIFHDPQTPVGGNPQSEVTLVELVTDPRTKTKRVLRAILKAADFCVTEPEQVARSLVAPELVLGPREARTRAAAP